MHDVLDRGLRLVLASTAATAADVAALLLLANGLHLPDALAATLACLIGGALNFYLCRAWLRAPSANPALYAGLIVAGGSLWSGLLVHAAVARFHAPLLLAKAVAAAVVLLAWNYPISTLVVFPRPLVSCGNAPSVVHGAGARRMHGHPGH
jgi:putative flippase GtrA